MGHSAKVFLEEREKDETAANSRNSRMAGDLIIQVSKLKEEIDELRAELNASKQDAKSIFFAALAARDNNNTLSRLGLWEQYIQSQKDVNNGSS